MKMSLSKKNKRWNGEIRKKYVLKKKIEKINVKN